MREFEIPDETIEAAAFGLARSWWTHEDGELSDEQFERDWAESHREGQRAQFRVDARYALAAAAPLILAAELDRWASILEVEAQRLIDSIDKADAAGLGAAGAQAALSRQAREMRAEVAELAWTSMKDVERELGPLTEVPAVPPAEPGVGA